MHKQKFQHDALFIIIIFVVFCYLFICLNEVFTWDGECRKLTHIDKGKKNNYSPIISYKLGITNPTPLKKNLVLEI
jgi:hypothetical protein